MRVDLFDFDLPEALIALRPVEPRDAARLLRVAPGHPLAEARVRDLPALLRPGDCLVFNDTRVIPARLRGLRARPDGSSVRVEAMLHRREGPDCWRAFARPGKRLREGDRIRFGSGRDGSACDLGHLDATVAARGEEGEITLAFDLAGAFLDEAVARLGELPLPPYIAGRRPADARDAADYQTVYAREPGAVAAPTAGLHFTPDLLARLGAAGIGEARLTLHVGAGTFLPVKAQDTEAHRMHAETGEITPGTAARLNRARAEGGRIVAVGTTSLRLLESAAEPDGTIRPFAGATDIFITPGYRFRAVDVLMTNFHLPRSTLFMLVSAFAGLETMRAAYAHAVAQGYRFYSYGDASLLFRAEGR
ncbi:S-adenosylmethionine--tRNA-ribosyltransferase-isomerase [Methylobacterium sp. 4-46]|uniref:S-adenosylmethionine:tRNA ribosyltransferase-isomerase n=1 Tax=Methylobacterium sp. (strain 4-46) TaxID=426117 RepID=QUEA_METS4|nr:MULTISPECIES: tRNA preQ1(34) S-adenosylmethionine ribosyltransferase-isomerase QueA [Methylobacterium]B0U9V5.1 RecName: Full=S-adenosylmethionine:tRNA ribosyltransferase-isomerase; AltName: Full=Queuosine biosynthesis protein QueA [Methylobacterium sp. 4-46]ACA19830.1 S-adenosylmethionine--tRNA-ribosyltransferase-isomerase [Methylobacterium sp. 4-46]WFT83672.1 tRNA preQ1(34) S-adenosylmethionine ribosyltransferase-isomerase QueA [Methylobacterium nodulans]